MLISVNYKCSCMEEEATVIVVGRSPEVDVVRWMESNVAPVISADHKRRSPICMATKTQYVKIPVEKETGLVGKKTTEH